MLDKLRRFLLRLARKYKVVDNGKTQASLKIYGSLYQDGDPIFLCFFFADGEENFGDWLSPYIVSKLTLRNILPISLKKNKINTKNNLVCVGSIGAYVNQLSTVLGVGVPFRETDMNANANYVFLRGPLTGEALEKSGGEDPGLYGDPAIVLPRLFPCERRSNGRIAFVPHYAHRKLEYCYPENCDLVSIMVTAPDEIESFVYSICGYDGVVTSSLHCHIICQSYKIPSALVGFEGYPVRGDGTKYVDYALGVGLVPSPPKIISTDLCEIELRDLLAEEYIESKKIDDVYFLMRQALGDYLSNGN